MNTVAGQGCSGRKGERIKHFLCGAQKRKTRNNVNVKGKTSLRVCPLCQSCRKKSSTLYSIRNATKGIEKEKRLDLRDSETDKTEQCIFSVIEEAMAQIVWAPVGHVQGEAPVWGV